MFESLSVLAQETLGDPGLPVQIDGHAVGVSHSAGLQLTWIWILVLLLAVQGIAVAAFILFRNFHGKQNLRQALAAAGLVWIIPAVVGLVYITRQATSHFQLPDAGPHAMTHEQQAMSGDWAVAPAQHAVAERPTTDGHSVTRAGDGESVPGWVTSHADWVQDDNRVLRHVHSQQFATVDEAQSQALADAASIASHDLHEHAPYTIGWEVTPDLVRQHAVRNQYIETVERDFGQFTAQMYRAHLQLELSPRTREQYQSPWKEQLVRKRLTVMGSVVGFVTLILVTAAAYLRLDAATRGAHRRGLQWAAASLVVAGTVAAGIVIQTV